VDINELRSLVSVCRECELAKTRFDIPILGQFSKDAKILLIGEGPGAYEERTLFPFVGVEELLSSRCIRKCPDPTGCLPLFGKTNLRESCILREDKEKAIPEDQMHKRVQYLKEKVRGVWQENKLFLRTAGEVLNKVLRLAGYSRPGWGTGGVPISITNTVRCRSLRDGKNAPPGDEPRVKCWTWTSRLLDLLKPQVIIACGVTAAEVLLCTKNVSMGEIEYKLHDTVFGPVYVMPHPAAPLYAGTLESYIEKGAAGLKMLKDRLN
jgi:uracil-DNA glycosylase family 4